MLLLDSEDLGVTDEREETKSSLADRLAVLESQGVLQLLLL